MIDRKFDGNPYYNPKQCGLEIILSYDVGYDYVFDMFVIWKDKETGHYYCGSDAGCS